MEDLKWNINKSEEEKIVLNLFLEIFDKNNVTIENFPVLLKNESRKQNLILKKNNKIRNINYYIKKIYGSINKFLYHYRNIIILDNNSLKLNKDYLNDRNEYDFL